MNAGPPAPPASGWTTTTIFDFNPFRNRNHALYNTPPELEGNGAAGEDRVRVTLVSGHFPAEGERFLEDGLRIVERIYPDSDPGMRGRQWNIEGACRNLRGTGNMATFRATLYDEDGDPQGYTEKSGIIRLNHSDADPFADPDADPDILLIPVPFPDGTFDYLFNYDAFSQKFRNTETAEFVSTNLPSQISNITSIGHDGRINVNGTVVNRGVGTYGINYRTHNGHGSILVPITVDVIARPVPIDPDPPDPDPPSGPAVRTTDVTLLSDPPVDGEAFGATWEAIRFDPGIINWSSSVEGNTNRVSISYPDGRTGRRIRARGTWAHGDVISVSVTATHDRRPQTASARFTWSS